MTFHRISGVNERQEETQRQRSHPITRIGVAPLVSLAFLLLVAFVVTFPTVRRNVSIHLPGNRSGGVRRGGTRSIAIGCNKRLFFGSGRVSRTRLRSLLRKVTTRSPRPPLLVHYSRHIRCNRLVGALRVIGHYGVDEVTLMARTLWKKRRQSRQYCRWTGFLSFPLYPFNSHPYGHGYYYHSKLHT